MDPRSSPLESEPGRDALTRVRWVIGVPYFVQGASGLVEVPILYFIKFTLGMGDPGGQLFYSLRNTGWFVKPLWGFISDRVALFGYHRKSWFVLMAGLAVVIWTSTALLAFLGVRVSLVYLVTFNLAFATYAFVDVVADALMVTWGRRLGRVGQFVNLQWGVLGLSSAGALMLGGWLQGRVEAGEVDPSLIFLLTGIPALLTAVVGVLNIDEPKTQREERGPRRSLRQLARRLRPSARAVGVFLRENRTIWILMLFVFLYRFRPSIGYIERSYLIDVRDFTALSFGVILSVGSVTFLLSLLAYVWVVRRFSFVAWYHYLYGAVTLAIVAFPLSFFLYLDPSHPWWDHVSVSLPAWLNPLPEWNRYQWFRLIFQNVLGFAMIPAFIIPMTIAGETVKIRHAGVAYASLMSLLNVSDAFEGLAGAGLYTWMTGSWLVQVFAGSVFDIAGSDDERTLVLQLFVYIGLVFNLLSLVVVEILRRELARGRIDIRLGRSRDEVATTTATRGDDEGTP